MDANMVPFLGMLGRLGVECVGGGGGIAATGRAATGEGGGGDGGSAISSMMKVCRATKSTLSVR